MNKSDIYRKKLLYRSINRGCKETDILIGSFAQKYINILTASQLTEYEKILDIDDVILYNIICEKISYEDYNLNPILMKMIIACHHVT